MLTKYGRSIKRFLSYFYLAVFAGVSTVGSAYASAASSYSEYLQGSLRSVGSIIETVSVALGIGLGIGGLFLLKKYGQARTMMSYQLTLTKPLLTLVASSAFLILPTFISTLERAVWGDDWYSTTISLDTSSDWTGLVTPVLMLIRILGVIALIRGILLVTKAGGQQAQPGAAGKAAMHIIAGILCVNINGTASLLGDIFDFSNIF